MDLKSELVEAVSYGLRFFLKNDIVEFYRNVLHRFTKLIKNLLLPTVLCEQCNFHQKFWVQIHEKILSIYTCVPCPTSITYFSYLLETPFRQIYSPIETLVLSTKTKSSSSPPTYTNIFNFDRLNYIYIYTL